MRSDFEYGVRLQPRQGKRLQKKSRRKWRSFTRAGDWKSAFGDDAEEYFMAYHFAKAVEQITDAGRKEYPLPCYANAWLRQYPWYAGSYPSGGPVCEVHKIWKMAAPALFTLAPDIYVPYVANAMDEYSYEAIRCLCRKSAKTQ